MSLDIRMNYLIFASVRYKVIMDYIGNIKDYLSNILGFEVIDKGDMRKVIASFPVALSNFFVGRLLVIEGREHVVVKNHSAEKDFPLSLLIRRMNTAEEKLGRPCVLYLDALDGDRRRQLVKHKICFVVPDRQLYLPTLGTYFTEKRLNAYKEASLLTPAAQLLLLYHLQKERIDKLGFKDLSGRLNYPPKTISLVAAEIRQAGLCDIAPSEDRGKCIQFRFQGKELWEQALPMMGSPIDKVRYLCDIPEPVTFPLSYDDALSHHTDMGYMPGHSYAVEKRSEMGRKLLREASPTNLPDSTRIEFWKYNPNTLAREGYIDPLSMALIYKDHDDERVQGQIERLLNKIL